MPLVLPRPITVPHPSGDGFELAADYCTDVIPAHRLEILAGFHFDGASIPRVFWLTTGYPMEPDLQAAALIHDANYAAELVPREFADDLFYHCLRLDGVGWYRANKMWLAVRLGGGPVWARHTSASIAHARMYCHLVALKP